MDSWSLLCLPSSSSQSPPKPPFPAARAPGVENTLPMPSLASFPDVDKWEQGKGQLQANGHAQKSGRREAHPSPRHLSGLSTRDPEHQPHWLAPPAPARDCAELSEQAAREGTTTYLPNQVAPSRETAEAMSH